MLHVAHIRTGQGKPTRVAIVEADDEDEARAKVRTSLELGEWIESMHVGDYMG